MRSNSLQSELVSIIIPCHNAQAWLDQALTSALGQTWPHKEIIVVDDGSTDNSLEVARRFAHPSLHLLSQPQRGAAAARNHALRQASGDWIQYLDADDVLAPDKVTQQMKLAKNLLPGRVLTGRWGRFVHSTEQAWFYDANPLFANLSPRDYLLHYAKEDCMMHPAAWLLPRSVVESAGPWDEALSLNDDGEYFARVVAASSGITWCQSAVSFYRSEVPGSLSGARSRRHLESAHRALLGILNVLSQLDDSSEMRSAAADLCQRFAYEYYPMASDLVADAERLARERGGSQTRPPGGPRFQILSSLVGWKTARRISSILKPLKRL